MESNRQPIKQPKPEAPKPGIPTWAEKAKYEWIELEADRNERDK